MIDWLVGSTCVQGGAVYIASDKEPLRIAISHPIVKEVSLQEHADILRCLSPSLWVVLFLHIDWLISCFFCRFILSDLCLYIVIGGLALIFSCYFLVAVVLCLVDVHIQYGVSYSSSHTSTDSRGHFLQYISPQRQILLILPSSMRYFCRYSTLIHILHDSKRTPVIALDQNTMRTRIDSASPSSL